MLGRRYSLAIETEKGPESEPLNEPVRGFLVERDSNEPPSPKSKADHSKSLSEYSLCDLDNISQLNYQFQSSSKSIDPKKKHMRRHTVAVKFQVPHSASGANITASS